MDKQKFYYLASPFTSTDKELEKIRAFQVTEASAYLLVNGILQYSPVVYSSSIVRVDEFKNLPGSWDFWKGLCTEIISRLDGFIVLTLDGWDVSVGVLAELELAESLGLPIYYMTLDDIKAGRVDELK